MQYLYTIYLVNILLAIIIHYINAYTWKLSTTTTSTSKLHFYSQSSKDIQNNINAISSSCEDGINLITLTNYNEDSEFLYNSIKNWLNNEYIPLDIHDVIGENVRNIYLNNRKQGILDLGELIINIGTELESIDFEKAFVNPWDVANKVSDLLILKLDRELCSCANDMKVIKISKYGSIQYFNDIIELYSSLFDRYRFCTQFIEEEKSWDELQVLISILFGFRSTGKEIVQIKELIPIDWEFISLLPTVEDLKLNENYEKMFLNDLPNDEVSVESVMETLIGLEAFKTIRNGNNKELQKRVLVISWMFVHGFLEEEFPLTQRFIPGHKQEML